MNAARMQQQCTRRLFGDESTDGPLQQAVRFACFEAPNLPPQLQ